MTGESLQSAHRADTAQAHVACVERAVLHMRARFQEKLDLAEIARVAAMSKYHLVRVFNEVTGTTPRHFVACLRMQRAKELLLTSDRPISEICLEVGYASLGTFSTTFTSLVGVSPQEFRALPKRPTVRQFATAVWRYLAGHRRKAGPLLRGVVEGPEGKGGFTFVGTFTGGVPQGAPYSGTVMTSLGAFCIEMPPVAQFHLLATVVPFSAPLSSLVTHLPSGLIASQRVRKPAAGGSPTFRLQLRPPRLTDPPIVLALPALLR